MKIAIGEELNAARIDEEIMNTDVGDGVVFRITVKGGRLADSLDSLLFYVEVGMGVAILDRNTRLENNRNIRVLPMENEERPDVVTAWLKTNGNPYIQKMVDCLKSS